MNLLLLDPGELRDGGIVELTGRRQAHAQEVLRAAAGDTLRVGILGGRVGTARVMGTGATLRLHVTLGSEPPPRADIDLLLALPRPKALRKLLPAAASLGVARVVLVNAARVEKSFFQSSVLEEATELMKLGLEQARDTLLPELLLRHRFRPFVEDELDALFPASTRLVAHPGTPPVGTRPNGRLLLAIGPEGGWVPFELDLLQQHGFRAFSLGPRPLRVEVAVPYAFGALGP